MESLKKHGFVVGVIGMVIALGVFAYFVTWKYGVGEYRSLQKKVRENESKLASFSKMGVKDLPTERLVDVNTKSLGNFKAEFVKAEKFLSDRKDSLVKTQLTKDGEEFSDPAAFTAAFKTAVDELQKKYNVVRGAYLRKVFSEQIAKAVEATPFKLGLDEKISETVGQSGEGMPEAAQMYRIANAILASATDAKWGGVTSISFPAVKGTRETAKAKAKREEDEKKAKEAKAKEEKDKDKKKPTGVRTRSGGQKAADGAQAKEAETAQVNPRDLYERVKVVVAGEIRWDDVGPFLHALDLRAKDPDDPIYFVVEDVALNKQKDRNMPAFVKSEETFRDPADAQKAALDREVKLPAATIRLSLSVLKYKGFAQ